LNVAGVAPLSQLALVPKSQVVPEPDHTSVEAVPSDSEQVTELVL